MRVSSRDLLRCAQRLLLRLPRRRNIRPAVCHEHEHRFCAFLASKLIHHLERSGKPFCERRLAARRQRTQFLFRQLHAPCHRQERLGARAAKGDQSHAVTLLVRFAQESEHRALHHLHALLRAHGAARIDEEEDVRGGTTRPNPHAQILSAYDDGLLAMPLALIGRRRAKRSGKGEVDAPSAARQRCAPRTSRRHVKLHDGSSAALALPHAHRLAQERKPRHNRFYGVRLIRVFAARIAIRRRCLLLIGLRRFFLRFSCIIFLLFRFAARRISRQSIVRMLLLRRIIRLIFRLFLRLSLLFLWLFLFLRLFLLSASLFALLLFSAHAMREHEERRLLDVLRHHIDAPGERRQGACRFYEIDFGTISHTKGACGVLRSEMQNGMGNLHSRKHLSRSCRLLLQLGFLLRIHAAESFRRTLKGEHAPRDLDALRRLRHILHRCEHAEAVEQHG